MSVKPDRNRLSVRKKLQETESYIVSPVFPCGGLHLVVGDSGMGKSTWLLELLHDWSKGVSVMGGLISHPCEWVYVSMDRALRDTDRTLRRLGLTDWDIPAYAIEELSPRDTTTKLLVAPTIEHIHNLFPKAKLIVLEGLQTALPNTSRGQTQNKAESLWLINLRDQILNKGITVIATEHKPKKVDAGMNKRNTPLGTASLIGGSGTVVSFDYPTDQKNRKDIEYINERVVHVSGHNFAPYHLIYTRDSSGRFILETSRSGNEINTYVTPEDGEIQIDAQFSAWPFDRVIKSIDLIAWSRVSTISEHQMYKWLRAQITAGRVEMIRKGEYKKVMTQ
jgi:hypothetical protein